MPETLICSVGGGDCGAKPFTVRTGDGEKVPMCPFHGRVVQFGQALAINLELDDPAFAELERLLRLGCQMGRGTPSQGTGAEGQTGPPIRGGLQPAALGSLDGEAAT